MIDVKNKHIVVIGAAKSGVAVAVLLSGKGAHVFVSDAGEIPEVYKSRLVSAGIEFEEHGHSDKSRSAEFAVVSPGVPDEAPLVQYYLKAGKSVNSEIEVASWFTNSRICAITGSNGKTTTASWLAHTWKTAGKKSILAGNIGTAFSDKVSETDEETDVILEISSFQLDHIHTFHPTISAVLNITPDHLNRYQNKFENYVASKMRIMENQNDNDAFIFWYDDPVVKEQLEQRSNQNGPRLLGFSDSQEVPEGAFVRDGKIYFKFDNKEEFLMYVNEIGLPGRHNLQNGMATALAARASEIRNEAIRDSLMTFEGVAHRLELVTEIKGVTWYNDSKATNVNAVWYALQSFDVPMVLILGGRDKGNDYSDLIPQLKEKVHTIIAIGEGRAKIEEQLNDVVPNFETAQSMKSAVKTAQKWAKRGEVVLLSPACASFDMFDSYEHRGDVFKEAVRQLG